MPVVHFGRAIGIADEIIHGRGEKVAHGDGEQPESHDRAFHLVRSLRVGEFQSGNGNHRLPHREDYVGEKLPVHARLLAGINHRLDVPDDDITAGGEEQADAYLSQRRRLKETAHQGIDQVVDQGNEEEDENRIGCLHLRSDQVHSAPVQIHVLRLQRPRASAALIPERPENGHENIDNGEAAEGAKAVSLKILRKCFAGKEIQFRGAPPHDVPGHGDRPLQENKRQADETQPVDEQFPQKTEARRGNVHEFLAPGPKEDGGDDHGHARNAEGPARAEARISQQERAENGGDKRARVDGKIKPPENLGEQMLVRFAKLIAHVGRDARLDAPGSERNETEPDEQAHARVVQGQSEVPEAVNNRKPKNRLVLADETLGHDGSQNGQEINGRNEKREVLPRLGVAHVIGRPHFVDDVLRHEHDQNRSHPIEAETFGRLVADDEGNTRRHSADVWWRSCVFIFRHKRKGAGYGLLSVKKSAGVGLAAGVCAGTTDAPSVGLGGRVCSFCTSGNSPTACWSHEEKITSEAKAETTRHLAGENPISARRVMFASRVAQGQR